MLRMQVPDLKNTLVYDVRYLHNIQVTILNCVHTALLKSDYQITQPMVYLLICYANLLAKSLIISIQS